MEKIQCLHRYLDANIIYCPVEGYGFDNVFFYPVYYEHLYTSPNFATWEGGGRKHPTGLICLNLTSFLR